MKSALWTPVGLFAVAVLGMAAWLGYGYLHNIRAARTRIAAGRIVDTAAGPIEYAERGSGPPLLVIHGAAGGCDQGILIGTQLLPEGYRLIAPSRYGYLNVGIPEDASLEAQADAYAALLDELDVDAPVPVIAFPAGGPSALTFAMRHPERTSTLVMLSAISYTEPPEDQARTNVESAINRLVSSDLVFWLAAKFARPQVVALLGVPSATQERFTEADWEDIDAILNSMLPLRPRLPGIAVDQSRHFAADTPLDRITVPTLVMHAQDDALVPFDRAEHTAQSIAGAELIPDEYGGHFLAGHGAEVCASVEEFLARVRRG